MLARTHPQATSANAGLPPKDPHRRSRATQQPRTPLGATRLRRPPAPAWRRSEQVEVVGNDERCPAAAPRTPRGEGAGRPRQCTDGRVGGDDPHRAVRRDTSRPIFERPSRQRVARVVWAVWYCTCTNGGRAFRPALNIIAGSDETSSRMARSHQRRALLLALLASCTPLGYGVLSVVSFPQPSHVLTRLRKSVGRRWRMAVTSIQSRVAASTASCVGRVAKP